MRASKKVAPLWPPYKKSGPILASLQKRWPHYGLPTKKVAPLWPPYKKSGPSLYEKRHFPTVFEKHMELRDGLSWLNFKTFLGDYCNEKNLDFY